MTYHLSGDGYLIGSGGYALSASSAFPTSGLVARFEADEGVTTSGSSVTAWEDLTGNGNDLTATGAPTLDATGSPNSSETIVFDGTDDYLDTTTVSLPTGSSDRTILFFGEYLEQGCVGFSYGDTNIGQVCGLRVNQVSDELEFQLWGSGDREAIGSDGVDGSFITQTITLDNEQLTHYDDRTVIDTWNGDGQVNTASARITVGAEIDLSPVYNMKASAIFVYNRVLTSSELTELWDYIDNKYRN